MGLHDDHSEHGDEHDDEHDETASIHVPTHVVKLCVAIICLYLFWILETLARHFVGLKSNSLVHPHGHSHDIAIDLEGFYSLFSF